MPDHARSDANAPNEPNSLSPAQLAAVRLLLAGAKVTAIARQLQIDPKTLFRWRQSPAFAAELRRQHEQLCRALHHRPAPEPRRREPNPSRRVDDDRLLRELERQLGLA